MTAAEARYWAKTALFFQDNPRAAGPFWPSSLDAAVWAWSKAVRGGIVLG